ncbi:alkaline phosphatase D family protein [uncultured Cyclobacterium sp.]|uniref:alkaline phosphatase D family protein n=1 Tax=uncultured Cyclobacterium sp. TaxID=453820 RepID=UPI0030EEBE32|tara:strand:+ start:10247 stop:12856 length:2610 start_codon:yes stop_codon:yes gene_type:complete
MKRRKAIKSIALGTVGSSFVLTENWAGTRPIISFKKGSPLKSNWQNWPDMAWVGPEYWGNRLQDWELKNGKAVCNLSAKNRTLHSLTHQLSPEADSFKSEVKISWLKEDKIGDSASYVGIRLGARGKFEDYRSAAVFGKGLDAGINGEGYLFIDEQVGTEKLPLDKEINLVVKGEKGALTIEAFVPTSKELLGVLKIENYSGNLGGNIALVSHFPEEALFEASVAFSDWAVTGEKVLAAENQSFGPVCFAHYTLHDGVLKLGAQLAPIERIKGNKVSLQVKKGNGWTNIQEAKIDALGRVAHFRLENWAEESAIPYRVKVDLPLENGVQSFYYNGTIAEEPIDKDQVKLAVFSCNADYGFPDNEVSLHSLKHGPDMAVFLGDQFYESTGGFGIQTSPLEKSSLDYLRKWYMFGWSYREIFRHIPSAFIPDDHDVYHGNVWGEAGKVAPTDEGWTYVAQDQGGYKMPAEWVNMVQLTQTGHLPDAFDPTPVKQGIGTYYTDWVYGGVSFAILEDRKFKSAPKNVLPEEAKVTNGFIQNREFDIKKYYDIEADLLGERQLEFLKHWSTDWSKGAEMKAVLSQTNFCTVATLPEGSIIDSIVPKLPIPELGEYVPGDAPTSDMDSNGWPQKGRDEAIKIIRKAFALHIAGDQHLASVVQYGVDEFKDSGYAFAGPALNNLFPRRWWPPVPENHEPLPGKPKYTGDFNDGFGNKVTVHAVANPRKTGVEPALIHDRATGYGIVTFDKKGKEMTMECWPRYVDPKANPNGQYEGWPVTVSQKENYARNAVGTLPPLDLSNCNKPVVAVIEEQSGELVYSLKVNEKIFHPEVFEEGNYLVKITDEKTGNFMVLNHLTPVADQVAALKVDLSTLRA